MKTLPMDSKIVPLVAHMNATGFVTRASCQGHGWPLALPPFVAFTCDEQTAASLSRMLRNDAEAEDPRLNWEWHVDARFDQNHRLVYRLTVSNPRRRWYRWARPMLDADLLRLPDFLDISPDDDRRRDDLPVADSETNEHDGLAPSRRLHPRIDPSLNDR